MWLVHPVCDPLVGADVARFRPIPIEKREDRDIFHFNVPGVAGTLVSMQELALTAVLLTKLAEYSSQMSHPCLGKFPNSTNSSTFTIEAKRR